MANRLNMDVFVPALVFAAMAGKAFELTAFGPLALGALLLLLGCGLVAWPVARLLGVPAKTFVPPMLFNNSGNIGLPLAVLAWGEAALPAAVILFMVENTLHFSLGARLLDPRARFLSLWRVPVVAAAMAGLVVAVGKIPLWSPALMAVGGRVGPSLALFAWRPNDRRISWGLEDFPGRRSWASAARHGHRLGTCSGSWVAGSAGSDADRFWCASPGRSEFSFC